MDAFMQEQASALQLRCWHDGSYLHIQAQPPESASLPPTDLVAILDVSGSMESEAWVKNKEGIKESQGMTILSVLKHAVKTTIYNLSKKDRFGLVSFSDFGCVEYELEYMTENAQKTASDILTKLETEGSTNLWSGLFEGLETLRKQYQPNRQASLILLTDGEPNVYPPSSFEDMLEKYKAKHPDFIFTLYTIALGKYLDSKLLGNLADIGGGQYSFIPCPGFMGTIFVNSFTNILTTMCNNAELTIKLEDQNKIIEIVGFKETKVKKSLKQAKIPLGDIKYGQTRDVILKVEVNAYQSYFGTVSLKTWNWGTQSELITTCECKVQNATNLEKIQLKTQLARLLLCDSIIDVYNITPAHEQDLKKGQERMKVCANQLKELQVQQQKLAEEEDDLDGPHNKMIESMNGILKDVSGEVSLSVLKPDFWRQWGRHFYPSIRNAHFKQVCNNFIDPGVQFYGGKMFRELRNQVEETFMKIPPPQPTKKKQQEEVKIQQQNQKQQVKASKPQAQQPRPRSPSPVRMDAYYDCGGGGCFGGQCLVKTLNGTKRIDSIRKGDIIVNNNSGQSSKVIAIVKITSKTPIIANRIGQLVITPKHPIFLNGKWVKPIDVADANQFEFCQTFFNLVLDSNHTALIEGIVCTTLGHMIKGQKVEHPYFGTKLIIQDLQKMNGWNDGYIQIQNEQFKRDLDTGKVNGIQQQ